PSGQPVVRLLSGREIDVVGAGLDWAMSGSPPELSQVYAESAEGVTRTSAAREEIKRLMPPHWCVSVEKSLAGLVSLR
ncbi:hypothetical protein GTV15_11380, partial [Streptomyces sp. SID7803]|nr:hypothetical protein [Streptomyces sp. SID7803]